jgi:Holliday junction resolvasome RuvABC endonuclease subunit
MKATGLDLSMTATGLAYGEGPVYTHTVKTTGTKDGRLAVIKNQVVSRAEGSALVLIEGFLNKSFSAGITGMVHGAVRTGLIEAGIPYATFPPTSLKKYATGSGTADKTAMALAAFKRGGVEFKDDNQCDAWWLWVACMDFLESPVFSLPATQRDQLTKIKMEG